jgi:hypothetical protein
VPSARADQRFEIELPAVNAPPRGPGALAIAVGAAHVHLPAKAPRHPERIDFHENKSGTMVGVVKPRVRD